MGLYSAIGGSIDNWSATYLTGSSAALASALAPLAAVAFSLWLVSFGIRVSIGEIHEPLPNLIKRLLTIGIVYAAALSAGVYQTHIVPVVHGLVDGLAATLGAGGAGAAGTGGVFAQLDAVDAASSRVVSELLRQAQEDGPLSASFYTKLLAAVAFSLSQCLLLVILALEMILARLALAFLLALGPLFILCAAYEPLARFFESWTSAVISYCLSQVLIVAVMALSISIYAHYVSATYFGGVDLGSAAGAAAAIPEATNLIGDVIAVVVVAVAMAMLALVVPAMAAQMAAGASIRGFAAFAGQAMGRAVSTGLGRAPVAAGRTGAAVIAATSRAATRPLAGGAHMAGSVAGLAVSRAVSSFGAGGTATSASAGVSGWAGWAGTASARSPAAGRAGSPGGAATATTTSGGPVTQPSPRQSRKADAGPNPNAGTATDLNADPKVDPKAGAGTSAAPRTKREARARAAAVHRIIKERKGP